MANVNYLYDQYSSEDYLCHKLKPTGELLCGYCHQPYEGVEYNTSMTVCAKCGEVSFPYYED